MIREPAAESIYAYLLMSSGLFAIWLLLYAIRVDLRLRMIWVSLGTMPLGLSEPFFVPEYWNPPTLWDLARRTGFDMESLLFSFAVGGIVFAAYDVIFGVAPSESMAQEQSDPRHRYHLLAILSGPIAFWLLVVSSRLNPIYAASISMATGFVATLYCRPDLWGKMCVSGVLFFFLYFLFFSLFDLFFPGYVEAVWNLGAVSGLMWWGVPVEELMFAFTFGLYWSSMYEHITWRRNRRRWGRYSML